MKVQNPHDKFFKETFSNIEVARKLVKTDLTIQQIAEATGLPVINVEKIAQEMRHC